MSSGTDFRPMAALFILCGCTAASIACHRAASPTAPDVSPTMTPATATLPRFSHIIVLIMENEDFGGIVGAPAAPYINSLATTYGLATNYTGVAHPSLPNYMALTSGATLFRDDCTTCTVNAANLADEIEGAGRRWKGYFEDMPAPCTTNDVGGYAVQHNPFVHYANIVSNRARCNASVVPLTDLASDLRTNQLPDFVWITPNLCHDMHDCDVAAGDSWLAGFVPTLTGSTAFANSALFLIWDEADSLQDAHVAAIVVSSEVRGIRSSIVHSHYGLLRTIEDAWGLAPLGQSGFANAMGEFWH
jgi:hypothetical protein